MKKYYFLLFTLCLTSFVQLSAQIQKGGHFISGSISFSKNKTQYDAGNTTPLQNTGGQFGTSVGYSQMITDNWAVGVSCYYSVSRNTNDIIYSNNIPIDKITLKLRQQYANASLNTSYIYPLGEGKRWHFSLGSSLTYGLGTSQTDSLRATGTTSVQAPRSQSIALSFAPSLIFALSKHVFAQGYLGNLNIGQTWSTAYKNTNADLYIYPSWGSFGFSYYW